MGHFEKAGVDLKRVLRDVDPEGKEMPALGQELRVDLFSASQVRGRSSA